MKEEILTLRLTRTVRPDFDPTPVVVSAEVNIRTQDTRHVAELTRRLSAELDRRELEVNLADATRSAARMLELADFHRMVSGPGGTTLHPTAPRS